MRIWSSVEKTIGLTPLVRLERLGVGKNNPVFAKLESRNPSGSVKDRTALFILNEGERSGVLTPGMTVVEATSGNLGISLAMLCALRGYSLIILMPSGMSQERVELIRAYGAEVITVDGTMADAVKTAREISEKIGNCFIPDQFNNEAGVLAHYLTTGPEIHSAIETDILVAGVGSGGTVSGAGRYLKEKNPSVRVIAVEPGESNLLSGGRAGKHSIQGIGAGFIPSILDRSVIDEVISVNYEDASYASLLLARREGILSGISSGAALFAAIKVAKRVENKGKNVVVILPDGGEKYLSTGLFDAKKLDTNVNLCYNDLEKSTKRKLVMSFKIVTDSSADLRSLDGVDFASAPLKIITDNKEYVDDENLDVVGMLSDLKQYKGRSRSSCPSTGEFHEAFGEAENIFCITITSNLSGSCNAASTAAKQYKEEHPERNIHVIDSLSTGPENALVIEKLRELILAGKDFETIKTEISDYNLNHTRLLFALESMHNLANNGRISHIKAKMADLFGIRAIGRASDVGTLEMICKSRGPLNAANDIITNMIGDGYKGGRVKIHHANNLPAAELVKTKLLETFPGVKVEIGMTGGLCSFYAEQGGLLVGFEI